jgi:pimeloyl-ACP methyl ester carboxylesterase
MAASSFAMKAITVTARDGVSLSVQEWGNPDGFEVLFIHGFNQSHLSWIKQITDAALLKACRIVTFDLRGHGGSGKPTCEDAYCDSSLWASDVTAVMDAMHLRRSVIVAWSYGGRVTSDYLRQCGTSRLAGLNFASAVLKNDKATNGPGRAHYDDMKSDDLAANIRGTRGFLSACFALQPSPDDQATMLAYNMMVPPSVRRLLLANTASAEDLLPSIGVPVLLSHGAKDQIILPAMSEFAAGLIPDAKHSVYPDAGHAPFYEDAVRFNRELLEFVKMVNFNGS